jgi:hypothetical protein
MQAQGTYPLTTIGTERRLPVAAALALAAGLLVALIGGMARVPVTVTAPGGPLEAPAPSYGTSVERPEPGF